VRSCARDVLSAGRLHHAGVDGRPGHRTADWSPEDETPGVGEGTLVRGEAPCGDEGLRSVRAPARAPPHAPPRPELALNGKRPQAAGWDCDRRHSHPKAGRPARLGTAPGETYLGDGRRAPGADSELGGLAARTPLVAQGLADASGASQPNTARAGGRRRARGRGRSRRREPGRGGPG
jgi:hypothetical protein